MDIRATLIVHFTAENLTEAKDRLGEFDWADISVALRRS
jgi:hypothetical protein